MKPKIRLRERKTPFISSKEFLKIDAQYIDGEKLLKKIIEDRGKIITELNEEIECLNIRIAKLKSRNEEQENIINRFKEENRKIQKVLEANHIHNIPPIRIPKK